MLWQECADAVLPEPWLLVLADAITTEIEQIIIEPPHDKTNKIIVLPARLRSDWASTQSDQSPHSALNV